MACQGKSTYRIGCLTFSLCEVEPPGVNLHDSCPVFQFAGFEMDTLEVKTSFRMQCRMASERLTSHRQKRSACLSVHFSACVITWCDISGFWILFVCAVCAGSSLVSYFFWDLRTSNDPGSASHCPWKPGSERVKLLEALAVPSCDRASQSISSVSVSRLRCFGKRKAGAM